MTIGRQLGASQFRIRRFGWAADIPWLPDLLAVPQTVTGNVLGEAFGRQIALIRAIASGAPDGSAIQLRYSASGTENRIRCTLFGAANSQDDAERLGQIVAAMMPAEIPVRALDMSEARGASYTVDLARIGTDSVAEIRRPMDSLDPTAGQTESASFEPVIFPWTWSPQSLLATLSALPMQPRPTSLIVHLEPTRVHPDTVIFLQDETLRLAEAVKHGVDEPLARDARNAYFRWLRTLPRSAVHMRVLVAANGLLASGIAESLATDFGIRFDGAGAHVSDSAQIVRPRTPAAVDACVSLLEEIRSVPWECPAEPALAELLHTFEPVEAHNAFRFPVAPRGGVPGIGTRRPSALPQGASERTAEATVEIGSTTSGNRFGLALEDLNRHVFVAGVPGFGKSKTVQHLLSQLVSSHAVPFLVIDPAKSDYRPLFRRLTDAGHEVRVIRLDPHVTSFNPLAVPNGVDPITFGSRIVAALVANMGLEQFPFAPVVVERAAATLYGAVSGGHPAPTFRDLYRTIADQVERSGLSPEFRSNVSGALLPRIERFTNGLAGRTLAGAAEDRVPWEDIVGRPTLLELGAFAAPFERSLIFALLLAGLISWREAHPTSTGLSHVTVLEEAHRVLGATSGDDVGAATFVDAIAELRGAGEGIIVVDQSPAAVHPGVMRLTGTKLVHRVVDQADRDALAATMAIEAAAKEDMARLGPRQIIGYASSATSPELVDIDDVGGRDSTDGGFSRGTAPVESRLVPGATFVPMTCVGCPVACRGERGLTLASAVVGGAAQQSVLALFHSAANLASDDDADPRAVTYCATAAALGASLADRAWQLPRAIDELKAMVAGIDRAAAARGGTDG